MRDAQQSRTGLSMAHLELLFRGEEQIGHASYLFWKHLMGAKSQKLTVTCQLLRLHPDIDGSAVIVCWVASWTLIVSIANKKWKCSCSWSRNRLMA
jgi:hypothetical protein